MEKGFGVVQGRFADQEMIERWCVVRTLPDTQQVVGWPESALVAVPGLDDQETQEDEGGERRISVGEMLLDALALEGVKPVDLAPELEGDRFGECDGDDELLAITEAEASSAESICTSSLAPNVFADRLCLDGLPLDTKTPSNTPPVETPPKPSSFVMRIMTIQGRTSPKNCQSESPSTIVGDVLPTEVLGAPGQKSPSCSSLELDEELPALGRDIDPVFYAEPWLSTSLSASPEPEPEPVTSKVERSAGYYSDLTSYFGRSSANPHKNVERKRVNALRAILSLEPSPISSPEPELLQNSQDTETLHNAQKAAVPVPVAAKLGSLQNPINLSDSSDDAKSASARS